jgi:hypothetical protein
MPMSHRAKRIWAILAVLAMACFVLGWPIYKKFFASGP